MGMKLKSGADLCGFELSRFCVQNDVAIPDAPASGRKYFHTGTGMEGKYSLLNRERIFTGTSWRAAAYVDDLANLDITSNEDFVALKTKVEAFLEGDVDSDGVLENLKEIQAFLDNYSSATDLTAILDKKLDKTGGKARDLAIVGSGTTYLTFESTDGKSYGSIGISSAHVPKFWDGSGAYTLIHEGNIYEKNLGLNNFSKFRFFTASGDSLAPKNESIISGFTIAIDGNGSFKKQLAFGHDSQPRLYARSQDTGTWSDWKTIAFTEFINAQELQWQDASGNAKNVLFLDGYNDLVLGRDTSLAGYRTRIQGNSIELRYSTAQSTGLILNSSGNMTVGESDKAGTDYKLYVVGAAKAVGGLLTTNLAIECDENGVQAGYFSEINHVKGGNLYLQVRQGDLILSHVNGATTIRGTLSVAGYTAINNSLAVSSNIVANGTIACKGVAAEGSAPVGTVDKWAGSIASGTKSQTYTHGLGTTDITVAIYEKNGNEWVQILTDVDIVNANSIRVTFGANTTVEHRIVVMG